MKYTQIPANTFKELQLNAGVIVESFVPATQVIGDLVGATTGGVTMTAVPTYSDYGEDIDNCPKNMLELKKLDSWEIKLSGSFVTVTPATAKLLLGASDIDASDGTKIVPRRDVLSADFSDLWWVGDYSDVNESEGTHTAGFIAIHMMNVLSTGGLSISATDKAKGQYSFEFTAHFSMSAQTTVPLEVYVSAGA